MRIAMDDHGGPFLTIDWQEPLDAQAYLDATPDEAQIRGMFLDKVCKLVHEKGGRIGRERYIAFKLYPLKEHMTLMVEAVQMLYPGLSLREGLRELGAHAAPALRDSMIGRVFSSLVGDRPDSVLSLMFKSYQTTRTVGTAKLLHHVSGKELIVGLRDVHDFPDCLHIGIFIAVMRELDQTWSVELHRRSLSDIDVKLVNQAP